MIPNFASVPEREYDLYVNMLANAAVRTTGSVDIDLFWRSVQDRVPKLSELAMTYKDAVTNSADAERSNSIYNLVLSHRRRALSEKSIKALVKLYFNQRVTCGILDQEKASDSRMSLSEASGTGDMMEIYPKTIASVELDGIPLVE